MVTAEEGGIWGVGTGGIKLLGLRWAQDVLYNIGRQPTFMSL